MQPCVPCRWHLPEPKRFSLILLWVKHSFLVFISRALVPLLQSPAPSWRLQSKAVQLAKGCQIRLWWAQAMVLVKYWSFAWNHPSVKLSVYCGSGHWTCLIPVADESRLIATSSHFSHWPVNNRIQGIFTLICNAWESYNCVWRGEIHSLIYSIKRFIEHH